MKIRFLSILIITNLFVVGIMGFLMMGSISHNAMYNCPVAVLAGGDCPADGLLSLSYHHISALQSLSQSLIILGYLNLLLTALYFFVFILIKFLYQNLLYNFCLSQKLRLNKLTLSWALRKFFRWLTLFNKRFPSIHLLGA